MQKAKSLTIFAQTCVRRQAVLVQMFQNFVDFSFAAVHLPVTANKEHSIHGYGVIKTGFLMQNLNVKLRL